MNRRLFFLACTLTLYLAFLTRNYFWDGVMFSLQIEQVYAHQQTFPVLFHANHLLYSVFGYLLYAAAHLFHLDVRAITLLQVWNALVAAGVLYRVWTWSERLTRSTDVALLCTALCAFGATWWKFATDADPYIISVCLLLLAVLCAAELHPRFIPAAACHVGAMLFHELAVFGYVPILVALWLSRPQAERSRRWAVILYVFITASVTLSCYYACYRAGAHATHPTLLHWMSNYAGDTDVAHSLRPLFGANLASYGKLFAGGKLSIFREQWTSVSAFSLLVSLALLTWYAVQFRKREHRSASQLPPRLRWILWSWFLPYALFLAWFDPGNAGHKLFLWPPLVLLLGTTKWGQVNARALTTAAFALAAWNFGAFIFPHSSVQGDPLVALAQRVDGELPKDAAVYYTTFVPDDWYLEYFAPGRTWRPLTPEATQSATGTACFEATSLAKLSGRITTDPRLSWRLVDKQHNVRLECLAK